MIVQNHYLRTVCHCLAACLLAAPALVTAAPEYVQSEQTGAGSIEETVEPAEYAFSLPRPMQSFFRLREVFREGNADVNLRNYYLGRARDNRPNLETWAQGGHIAYATPWWRSRLRLGSTLYTSQKLYGPNDKDGSRLLKPQQQSFSVLGEAYLEGRLFGDLSLRAYRQRFALPYLNANDSRMVPNTFEAVTLYDFSGDDLVYGVAQTWRMKKRDSTNFISMTEAAGIEGPDRAVTTAGLRYTLFNSANISAVNHYSPDFINIFYSEFNSRIRTLRGIGFQLSAQYTRQQAVGDEIDGDFDTRSGGAKLAASYKGVVLTAAHTRTANNDGIRNNWGGSPSYLSIILKNFDRAGEDAWLIGLSTDFAYFGSTAYSAFINYAVGDTPDSGRNASPDQSEFDVTLDYRPESGLFKGLWFRVRGALAYQQGNEGTDLKDIRFIANYDFSVL